MLLSLIEEGAHFVMLRLAVTGLFGYPSLHRDRARSVLWFVSSFRLISSGLRLIINELPL